jgi:hypothetical protein
MKRLKLCIMTLIICFGLLGCKGINLTSTRRYAYCMNLNWHLSLPETDIEMYVKNSGASFTGDGIRYHILQYDKENAAIILNSFDWEASELDSELASELLGH